MKLNSAVQHFLTGKFVHYFVLFFITLSITAVMGTSFESLAPFRVELFAITYISSFVFLLEFAARIFSLICLTFAKYAGADPCVQHSPGSFFKFSNSFSKSDPY